ncbi:MAG: hypothetical protein ACRYG8_19270 [Janthinobacterium lividum]
MASMKSRPIRRLIGLAMPLIVTGCVLAPTSQPVTAQSEDARYARLAQRYDTDKQQGGMSAVIGDVIQCYQAATYPAVAIMPLRDCLILDSEGAREDRVASKAFGMTLPFYSHQAKVQRWGHYGPLAGFTDPRVLAQYISDGAYEVETYRHGVHSTG